MAVKLLNGLSVDGQELLIKCNTATQKYIEEFEANKVGGGAYLVCDLLLCMCVARLACVTYCYSYMLMGMPACVLLCVICMCACSSVLCVCACMCVPARLCVYLTVYIHVCAVAWLCA